MNEKLEKEIQSYFANVPIKNLMDITNVARDFYEKGRMDAILDVEKKVTSYLHANYAGTDEYSRHLNVAYREVLAYLRFLQGFER